MFELIFPGGLYFTAGVVILLITAYRLIRKEDR